MDWHSVQRLSSSNSTYVVSAFRMTYTSVYGNSLPQLTVMTKSLHERHFTSHTTKCVCVYVCSHLRVSSVKIEIFLIQIWPCHKWQSLKWLTGDNNALSCYWNVITHVILSCCLIHIMLRHSTVNLGPWGSLTVLIAEKSVILNLYAKSPKNCWILSVNNYCEILTEQLFLKLKAGISEVPLCIRNMCNRWIPSMMSPCLGVSYLLTYPQ